MTQYPVIGITIGDPHGIGPEVSLKALEKLGQQLEYRPILIGNLQVLRNTATRLQVSLDLNPIREVNDSSKDGAVGVLDDGNFDASSVELGTLSANAGKAAVDWVLRAGHLAKDNAIQAIVTAPINKEAARLAGCAEVGHMEIFQKQTNSKQVATMLMSGQLRVVHLTTHRSLRVACDYVTEKNVLEKIQLTDEYFKKWGWPNPKIGGSALNPHSSDGGLLGDEEELQITPAVKEAQSLGIDVVGPVPADTVFNQNIDGKFDVCIAMYHDQGHIPIKVYDWQRSVSVNLGLPFVRTSVDHGTAFDIAGKGVADHISMMESIKVAMSIASDRILP